MSICGKLHPTRNKRCTRGPVHVANGMPHRTDDGDSWIDEAITEARRPKVSPKPLSPRAEFRLAVLEIVRARMERTRRGQRVWEQYPRYDEMIEDIIDVIEEERLQFGRLNGQPLKSRKWTVVSH